MYTPIKIYIFVYQYLNEWYKLTQHKIDMVGSLSTITKRKKKLCAFSKSLKELQGLINVLLRLKLIVIDKLNHSLLVKNIGLSTRQCTKKIRWNSPLFSDFVILITQQGIWESVLLCKCLHQHKHWGQTDMLLLLTYV